MRWSIALLLLLNASAPADAGLHYSGETFAALPAKWRGFLLDHRALRAVANPAPPGTSAALLRQEYVTARERLEARGAGLDADELADLGAILIRLGEAERAVEVLRPAQRANPTHFRVAANLGTAWQLADDLAQAEIVLVQAARLAPEDLKAAEELHLKLVRQRRAGGEGLDDLFGVAFLGADGRPSPNAIADDQQRRLPEDAVALVQRLSMWLPADGRLLWQAAEMANAFGEVRTAANMLEGCVNEFGMTDPGLRERRRIYRAAADAADPDTEPHTRVAWKSERPLVRKFDFGSLPAVRPGGVNPLPWIVLGGTELDRRFRPTFPDYLKKLDHERVSLTGFMHPLGDSLESNYFLLVEYPVGCWFCEAPDVTGMVYAELPGGQIMELRGGLVKIEGRLGLNAKDPEDFLFNLDDVRVKEAD